LRVRTSVWWTTRSIMAAATGWWPKTPARALNGRLEVRIREACSQRGETSSKNRFAASSAKDV
jgi:hypothetical protein